MASSSHPEACDDGNSIGNDGCTNSCTLPTCGDGIVQPPEACDDGNQINDDACTNSCTLPGCGDGILQPPEACDDGNQINDDACTNSCTLPTCGDGIVQPGEQCDDANSINDDGCSNSCTLPACGDGIVQPPEACDDGNSINDDSCTNSCTLPGCGDGILQPGEACDDGNQINDDACTNSCTLPACGDGIVQPGEQCDDANSINDDGCSNSCTLPACGDGIVQPPEACDDGNSINDDSCTNSCTLPACGDGIVQPGEQCDDANSVNNDGCTNSCTLPACGDGIVQPPEACDDGNSIDNDGCTNSCTLPSCGDGIVQPPEQCDDGNAIDNDSCTNACTFPTYTLSLDKIGSGSGSVSGGGNYLAGETVALTANPSSSSTFDGWSPSPCAASFTMPAQNLTCTAAFNLRTYTVSASAGPGGTIACGVGCDPTAVLVTHGNAVDFTVTPDGGYQIDSVTGCNGTLNGTTYTTGPITANCTVSASFSLAIPAAPTGVSATDGTYPDRVRITWNPVAGTTYYAVLSGSLIDTTLGTSFDHTPSTPGLGLFPNSVYEYSVQACNSVDCSDPSSSDTGFAQLNPPTGVTAGSVCEGDVLLSWQPVPGAISVIYYDIYRDGSYIHTTPSTSYLDMPGVGFYDYEVRSCVVVPSVGYPCSVPSTPVTGAAPPC
ncbi:MAG: DUF4215 domain-containing protein [Candidatus Competibacteraceae bacterium]